MSAQRKYLILAFMIFVLTFIGIYFMPIVFSSEKQRTHVVGELFHGNADTSRQYKDGKVLFQQCTACHILFKNFTGPDLIGFTKRGPWGDKKKVLTYLENPDKFYRENRTKYIEDLYNSSPVAHQVFFVERKRH